VSLLRRMRVNELIKRYAGYGIAFLIAPAGYGKTEALLSAYDESAKFVSLIAQTTVDQTAQAVVAAALPEYLDAFADVLRLPESSRRENAIVNWLATRIREHASIIVIEDFQNINRDVAARSLIERVINETLATTRWIIASRETPDLPIAIWIANNQARLPILDSDLAFTVDEAVELAEQMDLDISRKTIENVIKHTEGWPIVVQLVLTTWTSDSAIDNIDFRARDVSFDYIASRIWNDTSEDEQRILLAAAVMPVVRPEVLEMAGFPAARRQLDQVSKHIPLLRQTSANEYRLHDLFRDFVIDRHEHQEGFLIELLTKAYESVGDVQQALEIATRNNRRDLVAPQLIASGIKLIEMGQRALVNQALLTLPVNERQKPVFRALQSYIAACEGEISGPLSQLRTIAFDELPPHIRGPIIVRASSLAENNGDVDAAAMFNDLLLVSEDVNLRVQGLGRMGSALGRAGEVTRAVEMRDEILGLIDYVALEQRAEVYTNLARICLAHNDIGDAYEYAVLANELAEFSNDSLAKQFALATLFRVVNIRGDVVDALGYIATWLTLIRDRSDFTHYTYALSLGLLAAGSSGNQPLFEQMWNELQRSRLPLPDTSVAFVGTARVMNSISRDAITDAIVVCEATLKKVKTANDKVHFAALLSLLYCISDDQDRAREILELPYLQSAPTPVERDKVAQAIAYRALAWWMLDKPLKAQQEITNGFVGVSSAATLLNATVRAVCGSQRSSMTQEKMAILTSSLRSAGHHGVADLVVASFVEHATKRPTPSQIVILRELYIGGTSDEIGRRLGKKTKTIDRAVSDICRLIGCSGRGAAIVYALEHGWLGNQGHDATPVMRAQ
jgi:ATP/maltotriose-dependent transcriptional regulator MalT/DNA-binding CsgD family transcriptional regulator